MTSQPPDPPGQPAGQPAPPPLPPPPPWQTQPIPTPYAEPGAGPGPGPENGLGTAGLVLAILAFLGAFVPLVGLLGVPVALVAIVLAVLGLVRVSVGRATNRGSAVTGVLLGVLALLVAGANAWLVVVTVNELDEVVDGFSKGSGASDSSPDGTGLAVGNWEVVGAIRPKPDDAGDFGASFRVRNVGTERDSAILTVTVRRGPRVLGSLACTTPEVRPGVTTTATCLSSSRYRPGWTEITLANTF